MDKHYFASCVFGWATDEDFANAVAKLEKSCGGKKILKGNEYWVYEVPLPADAPYRINNYMPLVKGITVAKYGTF